MGRVNSGEAAVLAARRFLQGRPGADGPFSVRGEQDFWIVGTTAADGAPILVFIDAHDGTVNDYSEAIASIEISKPE